jgi:hypothetical protein
MFSNLVKKISSNVLYQSINPKILPTPTLGLLAPVEEYVVTEVSLLMYCPPNWASRYRYTVVYRVLFARLKKIHL